jgi:hypothetical protein
VRERGRGGEGEKERERRVTYRNTTNNDSVLKWITCLCRNTLNGKIRFAWT